MYWWEENKEVIPERVVGKKREEGRSNECIDEKRKKR